MVLIILSISYRPSAGESVTRARKREMKEKKPQKLEGEEEEEDEEDESERLWETVHRRRPAKEVCNIHVYNI